MTNYGWPRCLIPRAAPFNPRGQAVEGPQTLSGRAQVSAYDAGYWVATLRDIGIRAYRPGEQNHGLIRALRAKLEGGANAVAVPVFDRMQPWPLGPDGQPVKDASPCSFDDGATYDDGTAMWQPVIGAFVVSAASARATSLVIDFKEAGDIVGGEYFSIVDRLHIIRGVTAETGTQKTCDIWPPLREAVAAGAELNFDEPVCLMRLASEDAADLDVDRRAGGSATMSFVEAI